VTVLARRESFRTIAGAALVLSGVGDEGLSQEERFVLEQSTKDRCEYYCGDEPMPHVTEEFVQELARRGWLEIAPECNGEHGYLDDGRPVAWDGHCYYVIAPRGQKVLDADRARRSGDDA
jgi:hypothetical protein